MRAFFPVSIVVDQFEVSSRQLPTVDWLNIKFNVCNEYLLSCSHPMPCCYASPRLGFTQEANPSLPGEGCLCVIHNLTLSFTTPGTLSVYLL